MVLTQRELCSEIAKMGDIDVTKVRQVFKSAEQVIFAYLSSTTPSEERSVKIFDGLSLESEYVPSHYVDRGMFEGHLCEGKIQVKPKLTRHFKDKINNDIT